MHVVTRTLCAAGLTVLAQGAFAACTVATVRGTWGYSYEGYDPQGDHYFAGLGLMTFATGTLSNNTVRLTAQRGSADGGTPTTSSASGTYTVTASCTGRSTNLSGGIGSGRLDFNIVEAGKHLQFILVLPNERVTLHGEAFKR